MIRTGFLAFVEKITGRAFGAAFSLGDEEFEERRVRMNQLYQLMNDNQRRGKGMKIVAGENGSEVSVYLYDAIGGWFGIDAKDFVKAIAGIDADTIHLHINSPGGDVFDARAMKTALERHPAKVVAHIEGLAASAASFIMLAADEIEISDGAFVMIHDPWGVAIGPADEMRATADLLDKVCDSIVADYQHKTDGDQDQIRTWMKDETWFDADEAVEEGFADRKFEREKAAAQAGVSASIYDLSAYEHAPEALTNSSEPERDVDKDMEAARTRARARLRMYEREAA